MKNFNLVSVVSALAAAIVEINSRKDFTADEVRCLSIIGGSVITNVLSTENTAGMFCFLEEVRIGLHDHERKIIVTMDDDFEFPEDIPALTIAKREGNSLHYPEYRKYYEVCSTHGRSNVNWNVLEYGISLFRDSLKTWRE